MRALAAERVVNSQAVLSFTVNSPCVCLLMDWLLIGRMLVWVPLQWTLYFQPGAWLCHLADSM